MADQLDNFNQQVWKVDALEHMRTAPDCILVRSRWVTVSRGDNGEPDMRARLVHELSTHKTVPRSIGSNQVVVDRVRARPRPP